MARSLSVALISILFCATACRQPLREAALAQRAAAAPAPVPQRAAIAPLRPERPAHYVAAAQELGALYSNSPLREWKLRVNAAGADCDMLFIHVSIIMEDAMIEALHYGAGAYDIYEGGPRQFVDDRAFRGVAYQDATQRIWTFGNVTSAEAQQTKFCR